MRKGLKADDVPILAALLLWNMFLGDDEGAPAGGMTAGATPPKREPKPRPSPASAKK